MPVAGELVQLDGLLDLVGRAGLGTLLSEYCGRCACAIGCTAVSCHGTEMVGQCEIEGDNEKESSAHVVVLECGQRRDLDRSLIDVGGTAPHVRIRVHDRTTSALGIGDAAIQAAVLARTSYQ